MTEVSNLFSNFNDLTKKSVTDLSTDYNSKGSNPTDATPALTQGKKFKKYQKQITKRLEASIQNVNSREGFQGSLTKQSKDVINNNNYSSQQGTIENLKQEHQATLTKYENLIAQISGSTSGYLDRVSPNNPYLNKNVCLSGGACGYVTNQGVFKWYPADNNYTYNNTAGKNGCPSTPYQQISGDGDVNAVGSTISSNPPLIVGTPMSAGQSCGNEGTNVFVNKLINNPTATYTGCYADNTSDPLMKFIGDSPPPPNLIQNGSFSQPTIQSNSYQYLQWNASMVPGWNFNCAFVNNSQAWGYPMPYPNGPQCASIQTNQQLWTSMYINFSPGVMYTLTFSACGRNCCDGSGKANPINIGIEGVTFYTLNASVNKWTTYSATFTVEKSGGQRVSFIGDWTSSDRSTAIQNISLSSGSSQTGMYTYDSCKSAAIDAGYQYFALQNVNASTSKGFCAVSNSEPAVTSLGKSLVPNKMTALWSSNTGGQTGNSATLSTSGALSVINSGGASVYSSPSNNANPANYIGCYRDGPWRAIPLLNTNGSLSSIWGGTKWDNTVASAAEYARANNYKYFSIQAANTSNGQGQAGFSNDLAQATRYGKASNCNKVTGSPIIVGGGWSNAIYSADGVTSNYFLILQDDGNMCIYRGTSPNDNQGFIWASGTNGKQLSPNPLYAAAKGKYGKNWISQGSTLASGDFIGSTNGNMALIMQADGNLVLYTFTMEANCAKMSDGNTGGNSGTNAVYNIGNTGFPAVMSKLAYIDQDSELHEYPSSNTQYSKNYTSYTGVDSAGYDIPGAAYGNATVEQCQTTCNSNEECAGFAFSDNVCYPKTSSMFPNGARQVNSRVNLYTRNKEPIAPPIGVPKITGNVDSIRYNNYVSGGEIGNSYGLANATSSQQQQLSQLQTQLDQLTAQLNSLTGEYGNGATEAQTQVNTNMKGVKEYLNELNYTDNKIKGFNTNTNIENILSDSDIVVLQKNYDYLFWSILATGTVVVAMNIVKK
jgi:hypothetical protein